MPQNRETIVRGPGLLASASVLVACIVLGAFGGCNLDLIRAARTGRSVWFWLLAGPGLGLLIGLAAVRWDKSRGKPVSIERRFALRCAYACAWLVVAAVSFITPGWTTAHNWVPVNVPLRFDKANTVSATFTAELNATHVISVDLKRNLPFEDLNSLTGDWVNPDAPPHKGPLRPEIVWMITPAAADTLTFWKGLSWSSDTVGLGIGSFKAVSGRRYTLTAKVTKPSPTLQVLDPRLQVEITHGLQPHYYVPDMIAKMGGLIAGLLGVALLISAFSRRQLERKSPPSNL